MWPLNSAKRICLLLFNTPQGLWHGFYILSQSGIRGLPSLKAVFTNIAQEVYKNPNICTVVSVPVKTPQP